MKKLFTLFFVLSIGISAWGQVTDPTFSPLDNATGVSISPTLSMTFDGYTTAIILENNTSIFIRDIDNSQNDVSLSTGDGFLTPQDPRISMAGNQITLNLSASSLDYSTNYAVVIYNNTVDVDGTFYNQLQNFTKWSFTTEAPPTLPQWTATYPNLQNLSKTAIDVYGQVDLDGNCHLVVTNSSTAPSAANIKAGLDHTGVAAAIDSIDTPVIADTEFFVNLDITSLTSETQYWVYAVCDDGTDNFSTVEQMTFTTQDTQAPAYNSTYPSVSAITGTGATLNVSINDNGQFFWVVLPAVATAPTAAQVRSGLDASDSPAAFSGNPTLTANVAAQANVTGLAYGTDYKAYIVSTDDNNNDIETSTASVLDFTTLAAPPSIFTYLPTDDAIEVPIGQSLEITFNENIQVVSGSTARVYIIRSIDDSEFVSYGVSNPNKTISGSTLTLNHATPFEQNTEYYVTMGNGFVESVASGVDFGGISSTTQWTFTTEVLAPQWNPTFPNITPPTKTDVVVNGQVDKDGTYYLVLTQSAIAPSAAQIKLGNDENDAPALLPATGAVTANSTFSPSLDVTSLVSQTAYWVHMVTEDGTGNFSTIQSLTFTTQDTQAPTYGESFPSVEILDGTSISLNVMINDNGRFYYVILPSGDAAPSIAQVIAATDANDDVVPFPFGFDSPLNNGELGSGFVLGLNYSTSYNAYLVTKDDNNNYIETSIATSIPFTTPGPPPTISTYFPLQGATDVPISQSLQLTFNENIQLVAGTAATVSIRRVSDNGLFASYDITSDNISITDSILTITPSIPFVENRSYYVTIGYGFVESAATSGDFEGITESTDWTFTTEILPAQWAATFPNIGATTKASVVVNGRVSKSGNYHMVVTQNASTPTAAQVKLGLDEIDAAAVLTATGVTAAGITFSPALDISTLATQTQYYVYVVAETTVDKFSTVEQLTFTTVQTSWATTYPKIQNQTKTSMDVLGQVDAGGAYHLVVTASGTAPTEAQIIAGQNEADAPALIDSNNTVTANAEFSIVNIDLSGLTSLTNYWVHMLVVDEFGNNTIIKTIAFTQQDKVAPVYTAPTPNVTNISGIAATVEIIINEAGLVRYVILPATAPAPTIAQVWAGTDAGNTPVTNAGNRVLAADNVVQITYDTYTSETSYIAYLVTRDNNENYIETSDPTPVLFTTLDNTAPVATFDPENLAVDVLLAKTITITLSEKVYTASGVLITGANVSSIVSLRENSALGTVVTPLSVTYDAVNFVITIDPTNNLKELQVYNINLLSLKDSTGNALSMQNSTFTTQDLTPPVTTFVNPTAGEVDFSINAPLTISFNEAIRNLDGTPITDLNIPSLITFDPSITFTATINAEANLITIIPNADLSQSTTYTITVDSVEDVYGNEQLTSATTNFTTDAYQTWNGTTSDVFIEASNWTGSGASIIIPQAPTNQPVININNLSLNNVTVEAGASLTIAATGNLTITKSLELRSSIDPAIGNANLLNNGTLTTTGAKVKVEQAIRANLEDLYISSPVSGATQNNTGISNSIYRRNASVPSWELLSSSEVMLPGVGYIAYGDAGDIINFNGAINNSDVGPIATVRTSTPNNFGWNLIGNPYPCSIDWEGITTNNMNDIFYILNTDTKVYGTYNGNDGGVPASVNVNSTEPSHIPSCHSFWTQVAIGQTTGNITIPKSARVNTHYTYLKNAKVINSQQIRFAGINSDNVKDEILISFDTNASNEFDSYDAEKRFSDNKKVVQFYTLQSSQKLAINTYNNYELGRSIELGYKVGLAGDYKLALIELLNAEENAVITIEDKLNSTLQTMGLNDEYAFTTNAGTFENRFVVHITPSISTKAEQIEDNYPIRIFNSGSYIYIKIPELTKPYYQVYNTSGRLLQSGLLQAQGENKIYSDNDGLLLIKIISNEKIVSQKVFVKK